MIENSGEAARNGDVQQVVFKLSRTGDVGLGASVFPAEGFFKDFGPSPKAEAPAPKPSPTPSDSATGDASGDGETPGATEGETSGAPHERREHRGRPGRDGHGRRRPGAPGQLTPGSAP